MREIEFELKQFIEYHIDDDEVFISFDESWMADAFEDWFRNEGSDAFALFCGEEYKDFMEE